MRTKYISQPSLMREAMSVLIGRLGVSKAGEFWSGLGYGKKDYTDLRKNLFSGETASGLYRKAREYEKNKK